MPNPPVIILLNGPPGSGKSSGAKFLNKVFIDAEVMAFAQPLKDATHKAYGILDIPWDFYNDHPDKDKPLDIFNGYSPREAYIDHSENYAKILHGQDVWARALMEQIVAHISLGNKERLFFVEDCGFQIEYNTLAKFFVEVHVLAIHRPGHTFAQDSREYVTDVVREKHWQIYNDKTVDAFNEDLFQTVRNLTLEPLA